MKHILHVLLGFMALSILGCGGLTGGKAAADKGIVKFHDQYNAGKVDDMWTDAASEFRSATTKTKFDEFMGAVQRKLGKVTSSANAGWRVHTFNLKTSVQMTQNTVFEQGNGTESFVFVIDGSNAVLQGYNIQSMDLITK